MVVLVEKILIAVTLFGYFFLPWHKYYETGDISYLKGQVLTYDQVSKPKINSFIETDDLLEWTIYKDAYLLTPSKKIWFRFYLVPQSQKVLSWALYNKELDLILVDKKFTLPHNYQPPRLVGFYDDKLARGVFLDKDTKEAFLKLQKQVKKELGIHLTISSGYRSYSTQARLFSYYSLLDGKEKANTYSARPGHSQHQTAKAIDIGFYDGKRWYFLYEVALSPYYERLRRLFLNHGFVQPYVPYFKDGSITSLAGYVIEPWHLLYIGRNNVKNFLCSGLEFLEWQKMIFVYNISNGEQKIKCYSNRFSRALSLWVYPLSVFKPQITGAKSTDLRD